MGIKIEKYLINLNSWTTAGSRWLGWAVWPIGHLFIFFIIKLYSLISTFFFLKKAFVITCWFELICWQFIFFHGENVGSISSLGCPQKFIILKSWATDSQCIYVIKIELWVTSEHIVKIGGPLVLYSHVLCEMKDHFFTNVHVGEKFQSHADNSCSKDKFYINYCQ